MQIAEPQTLAHPSFALRGVDGGEGAGINRQERQGRQGEIKHKGTKGTKKVRSQIAECKVQKAKRQKIASGFVLAMTWGYVAAMTFLSVIAKERSDCGNLPLQADSGLRLAESGLEPLAVYK